MNPQNQEMNTTWQAPALIELGEISKETQAGTISPSSDGLTSLS
jgi:hypothetical protein